MTSKEYFNITQLKKLVVRGKKHKFMVNVILHSMDDFMWFNQQVKLGNIQMCGNEYILKDSENINDGTEIMYN